MTTEIKAHAYEQLILLMRATAQLVVNGEITESEASRILSTLGAISCMSVKAGVSLPAAEIEKRACEMLLEDAVESACEKLIGGGA